MQKDHLKVKQSARRSFLLWVIFKLCGLEPYLDLAGDHCTIRHAMFHSSKQKVDFLLMEQTFSCLLLKCSSCHSWRCTQAGLRLIVPFRTNNKIIKTHRTLSVYGTADSLREELSTCRDENSCLRWHTQG